MISTLVNLMTPRLFAALIAVISATALGAAFTAQFGFGLNPCQLCLMQRVPFALNILLGIGGMIWLTRTKHLIGLAGLVFLGNSGLAFFHTGVERHWWQGLEGCSTPDMSGSIEDLMSRIQHAGTARCDEIPWELFGLSMANYNVMMCLGLAIACFGYLFFSAKIHQRDILIG